ncbi:hypothetical protein K488DRAFT_18021, partial [Vararia minispora EC-137]
RPIIVVTGANNGIGFGICRRLLYQLSLSSPTDALPLFDRTNASNAGILYPCEGVTLVMACRSIDRAKAARAKLFELFEKDVSRSKLHRNQRRVANFKQNIEIDIHRLDLASVQSVLDCCNKLGRTYPYISHVICNAGVAPFVRINWLLLLKQSLASPLDALTYPKYNVQETGKMSNDGLGWVWQCNVFGHYILARTLEPMLAASATGETGPGRVIWQSSLEALPEYFDPDDWQLVKTVDPYHASKYHMDLIGAELNRRALQDRPQKIRHILVEPGVVHTSIDLMLINTFLHHLKHISFWLARFIGSKHHNISAWNGAAAAVHAALVSFAFL